MSNDLKKSFFIKVLKKFKEKEKIEDNGLEIFLGEISKELNIKNEELRNMSEELKKITVTNFILGLIDTEISIKIRKFLTLKVKKKKLYEYIVENNKECKLAFLTVCEESIYNSLKENISSIYSIEQSLFVKALKEFKDIKKIEDKDLKSFLKDNIINIEKLNITNYISKFTNPSAPHILIKSNQNKDKDYKDYKIHNNSIESSIDVVSSAAYARIRDFLMLKVNNDSYHYNKRLYEYILENNEECKQSLFLICCDENTYNSLKENISNIFRKENDISKTDHCIKQIFFPTTTKAIEDDDYHLLSILESSSLLDELKNRINQDKDKIKKYKEEKKKKDKNKDKKIDEKKYFKKVVNLTEIKYGGSKPQNISYLNKGNFYLLPCIPPSPLKNKFPKHDFFKECVDKNTFRDNFLALDKLLQAVKNYKENKNIKDGINRIIEKISSLIADKVLILRSIASTCYFEKSSELPIYQVKILVKTELIDDQVINKFIINTARCIIHSYEKFLGEKAILLDDSFYNRIVKIITDFQERGLMI